MGRARTPVRADSWGPRTAGRGLPALPERRSIAIPGVPRRVGARPTEDVRGRFEELCS
jgi:hypothetical protein